MRAIVMHGKDNVATLLHPAQAGDSIAIAGTKPGAAQEASQPEAVTAREPLAFGHKLALRPLKNQDAIVKYGEVIGYATQDIAAGMHVHVHNMVSGRGRAP